jgi:hypothetical protein
MDTQPKRSQPLSRRTYVLLALATIVVGFVIHHHGHWLGDARDILGDALWAAMMVWWISALRPATPAWIRLAIAFAVAAAVETSQAFPILEGVRNTRLGHLVLGSYFDPRDFASYAAGVLAAGLIDRWLRRQRA